MRSQRWNDNWMQQTGSKEKQDKVHLSGKGDPLGIVQEMNNYYTTERYIHKPESVV